MWGGGWSIEDGVPEASGLVRQALWARVSGLGFLLSMLGSLWQV